ncbi:MAG: DNRLRE domain-containing protein [Promethearchaeota archaeon]|jgi:hypothetical protein
MKVKKKTILALITLTIVIIVSISVIFQETSDSRIEIRVNKDSYVYQDQPNLNYGGDGYLYVGNYYSGRIETYYHFNISTARAGWTKAVIKVFFDYASSPVDVGANLTYASWNESDITWNNKPSAIIYRGHIVNDGFNFNIPLTPENFSNEEVTICLYGKGGVSDGYIRGTSKESVSQSQKIPFIELTYDDISPGFIVSMISLISSIFSVYLFFLIKSIKKARRKKIAKFKNPWVFERLPARVPRPRAPQQQRHQPIHFPREQLQIRRHFQSRRSISKEQKINDYITLKLENGRTFIYVNGRRFIQCIRLILNIPKNDIHIYDEIESIDEAARVYSRHLFQNRILQRPREEHDITPEQEFWGHCSNLQAWVEHDYDTRVLMSNISFPLLRALSEAGDPQAKKVFREEIAQRLESGYPSVFQYLINQGYLKYFTPTEFSTIIETTDLVVNLSSQINMLTIFLHTCASKFPSLLGDVLLKLLNLPEGKASLIKSFSTRPMTRRQPISFRLNPQFFQLIRKTLQDLINKVREDLMPSILACIQSIDSHFKKQDIGIPPRFNIDYVEEMMNRLQNNIDLREWQGDRFQRRLELERRLIEQRKKAQSKCSYCGRELKKGQITCDWCGHRNDDDPFYPYPYIFKPPGPGGGFKEGAIAIPVRV